MKAYQSEFDDLTPTVSRFLITLILVFSFIVRFQGINWGLPDLYNPDEFILTYPVTRFLIKGEIIHWPYWPGDIIVYLLTTLFTFVLAGYFFYQFASGNAHNLTDFRQLFHSNPDLYIESLNPLFYISGRLFMVTFATFSVYLVYIIARKYILNHAVAILAALCLAIAPLFARSNPTIRPDIASTMFVLISVFFLLKCAVSGENKRALILSCIFGGFAISAKYTSLPVVLPILIHCVKKDFAGCNKSDFMRSLKKFVTLKLLTSKAVLFILLAFFLTAPMVILNPANALFYVQYNITEKHPGHEGLPGIENYLWYLLGPLKEGIGGAFFGFFALMGLFFILLHGRYRHYLFLIFPITFFLLLGCLKSLRWERWAIPILPFEAILFGLGFYKVICICFVRIQSENLKKIALYLLSITLMAAVLPIAAHGVKEGIKLWRTDTRTLARDWINKNIPKKSKIAYEYVSMLKLASLSTDYELLMIPLGEFMASQLISFYKSKGVNYIIVCNSENDIIYEQATRFATEINFYIELQIEAKLIKEFDTKKNPGPSIKIYKL